MKKIFKLFGVLFSVVLMGAAVSACFPEDIDGPEDLGLGIKTVFPTKVVPGLEITVNGSGLSEITEVVFPEAVTVTNFKVVTDNMIRVVVPNGVQAGKLVVRNSSDTAESSQELSIGKTVINGYSKQEEEEIEGGSQISIYGKDLEFIASVEIFDEEGNSLLLLKDTEFYRKGTDNVTITLPKKMTDEDTVIVGKITTIDGKVFTSFPKLLYKPKADEGGGYWTTVETVIWENPDPEGNGAISWGGTYRFALEGTDGNAEAIAEIPAETWEKMKTTPFYMQYSATDPTSYQVRVTTGWWSVQWLGAENDIAPWNMAERIIDNEDGTFSIMVDFSEDPAILDLLDEQHLLFTGSGFTVLKLYFSEEVYIEGGGHFESVKTSIWKNDDPEGNGAISWGGKYRFALEGTDGNAEAIAEIPAETWEKMKTTPFYMQYSPTDPTSYQVRVTTGWWSVQWLGAENDIAPWNMAERIIDNEDGTFSIMVDFSEDPAILDLLDEQHLLFTGNGFTVLELYFQEEVWVGGGESGPKEVDIWVNDDPEGNGAISWGGKYRFALEGTDGNSEAIAEIPADTWNKMMTSPFYMQYSATDPTSYQVRVTTGWWSVQWLGAENDIAPWNMAERIIDNEDGTFSIKVDFSEDDAILALLDEQHLLFTGNGFTVLRLYFVE